MLHIKKQDFTINLQTDTESLNEVYVTAIDNLSEKHNNK